MGVPSSPVRASAASGRCLKPSAREPAQQWWEVQDFVQEVCSFAGGPTAALNLAAVGEVFHKAVVEAREELSRRFPYRLYVVGGLDCDFKPVSTAWRFDSSQSRWEVLPSIASPCAGPAAVLAQGRLYVLGGEYQGDAVRHAQCFDPCTNQWEELAPMLEGRIRSTVVAAGGLIYVFGGLDGLKPLSSAERYDPRTNIWEALPAMHRPRYAGASAAMHEGCIIVFGGELTDAGCAASIERFDPKEGVWELLPAARAPPAGSAIALTGHGNTCFTVGGLGLSGQALAVAEQLPLGEALAGTAPPSWLPLPPMHTPRHLASVAGFGAGAVVVGGKGPTFEAIKQVEFYDPVGKAWGALPPLPDARLRAAVAGGRA